MIYKSLVVRGYRRYSLSKVHELTINLVSGVLLILGGNGSGKSSTLALFNPMPPSKNDFDEDGYWELNLTVDDKDYKLSADFSNRKIYSFDVTSNGETINYNPAGGISVQRKLVEEHLKLNNLALSLLTGKLAFSQLSPLARKDVIQEISGLDMDYATSVFKRLQVAYRDANGTVRNIRKDLLKATDELKSLIESGRDAVSDYKDAYKEVNQLLTNYDPNKRSMNEVGTDVKSIITEIDRLYDKYTRSLFLYKREFGTLVDPESLSREIYHLESKIDSTHQRLDVIVAERARLKKQIDNSVLLNSETIESVTARLNSVNSAMTDLSATISGHMEGYSILQPDDVKAAYAVTTDVISEISNMPDNVAGELNLDKLKNLRLSLNDAVDSLKHHQYSVENIISNLKPVVVDESENIKCPKCDHVFHPIHNNDNVDKLNKDKGAHEKSIVECQQRIDKLKSDMKIHEDFESSYMRLKQLSERSPYHYSLVSYIFSKTKLKTNAMTYRAVIDEWLTIAKSTEELKELQVKKSELERTIQLSKATDSLRLESATERLNELGIEYDSLVEYLDEFNSKLHTLKDKRKHLSIIFNSETKYDELIRQYSDLVDKMIESLDNDLIAQELQVKQGALAELSLRKQQQDMLRGRIEVYTSKLSELESETKVLSDLVKAISPNEGIIADQLMLFIEHMVKQVNDVVNSIYTYPLYMNKPNVDDGDLDYRFPVTSDESSKMSASDVSDLSTGQMRIMDFAFRLVALQRLGLNHFPLFLDEPDDAQDETHARNMMEYVKMITVDSPSFNGLLMINHSIVESSVFSNADILVLNGDNINTPLNANKHVNILMR